MNGGVVNRAYRLLQISLIAAFCLTACFLGSSQAWAATYYVDVNLGDDSNPGTAALPWRSINNGDVTGVLNPGDMVIVREGTYHPPSGLGYYLTSRHGTAENPIIYQAEGKVVLDGTPNGTLIGVLISTRHTIFDGFEVINAWYGLQLYQTEGGMIRNSRTHQLSERGVAAVQVVSPTLINNTVYDIGPGAFGIHVQSCTGNATILNNSVDGGTAGLVVFAGTANSTVRNNIFANAVYGVSHNQAAPATMDNTHNLYYNNQFDYLYNVERGANEFNANPRWVNPAAGDYTLMQNSTAINTGIDVGLPFEGPAPDIGAHESPYTHLPGFVQGTVVDAATSAPLNNARVATLDDGDWATTGPDGTYTLMLAPGNYSLRGSRPSYDPQVVAGITVEESTTSIANFALNRVPVRTYYVNDATGNDNNNGLSPAAAWKTISRGDALGILNPGDTVLIAPGTYPQPTQNGLYLTNNSGEEGLLITYKGNGGKVVIDQTAHQGASGVIYGIRSEVSYIHFDNFEVRNCQWGIWLGVEHPGNVISNCHIHTLSALTGNTYGIGAYLNTGVYAHNNLIHDLTSSTGYATAFWITETSRATIVNNTISNTVRGVVQIAPIPDNDRIVVKNNIIQGTQRALQFGNSGNDNSHNLLYNNVVNHFGLASPGPREFGANPLLNFDYTLQASSPAVNTGVDVGLPYNGPAPDIGAFESPFTTLPGGVVGVVRANMPGNPPLPKAKVALPGDSVFGFAGNDGSYYLPLTTGSYSLNASAPGFQTASGTVMVTSGSLTTRDWTLNIGDRKTYYVDGVNGNNFNSGLSPAQAWQTITWGDFDFILEPGDTVVVLPGTYPTTGLGHEVLNIPGAPLAPITYKASGPGVIIDGQGSAFGWVVWVDNIILDGFEIINTTYGIDFVNSVGHLARNLIVKDFTNAGLYTFGAGDVTFHNNLVVNTTQAGSGILVESHADVKVYNNTVVGTNTGINLVSGAGTALVKNNIVVGNNVGLRSAQSGPVDNSNNLYWNNTANYDGTAAAGPNELVADPLLDGDYKLMEGSPAIDRGVDVGLPFNGLAPDLGYFESSFTATPTVVQRIKNAAELADGTWVYIELPKQVTSSTSTFSDGSYYIEELDRAAGIKALGGPAMTIGNRITVTGIISTNDAGQKELSVSSATVTGTSAPLAPLSIKNATLGGEGVSVYGLLARTWGTVTYSAPDNSYFYIDDGSGNNDGTGNLGIRVVLSGLSSPFGAAPAEGTFVIVTGLAGLDKDGANSIPVIRPRGSGDVIAP